MSCIELYRRDLCHFHLLSIENIADFVTCSSIRAVCVCARVRACVCVCVVVGDGGWTNSFKIKQMGRGGWGVVGERSPHCGQIIQKIKQILIEQVTPLIFASKSTFSEHLHASIRSHHPHFKTHGPGFLSLN